VLFSFWGSGLENPLTYALLAILVYSFKTENTNLFIFISALLFVNRLDAVVYIAPLSAFFIVKHPLKQNLINFVKFGWPFYLHLIFTVLYYGSVFPNTYYAKVASIDIDIIERIVVGLKYILPIAIHSPLDIVFIFAPYILFFLFRKELTDSNKIKAVLGLVACSLTLFYVFWIGFDHLNPRLFGVPLFLGLLLVFDFFAPILIQHFKTNKENILRPAIITLVILLSIANSSTFLPIKKLKFMRDKDDGKNSEYYRNLKNSPDSYIFSDIQIVCSENRIIKSNRKEMLKRPSVSSHTVSFVAEAGTILEIGSNTHMVDIMGLADPLMSRVKSTQKFYDPGHNYRPIPRGYPE